MPVAPPTPPGLGPAAGTSADAAAATVRWGSLTVLIPEDSGVVAVQDTAQPELKPPHGGQVLLLFKGNSLLAINAEDGRILQDTVMPEHRATYEQILSTMVVEGPDKNWIAWPNSAETVSRDTLNASGATQSWGAISWRPPDRASGFTVYIGMADYPSGGSASFITITNGRSKVHVVDGPDGISVEEVAVAPEDREAIDRFLSTVR